MTDTPPLPALGAPQESASFHWTPDSSGVAPILPSNSGERQGSRFIQIGSILDGYQIVGLLGQGGMGAVYKAYKNGAHYALKVLLSDEMGANELARFEREAQAAAALQHPHIVAVHKLGYAQQCPYIIFDFVEGHSLDKEIQSGRTWTLGEAVACLKPIASALDSIHEQGIVHRDLKPANIMIRAEDQRPLLADFGLAHAAQMERLTRTGEVLGTPAYMTPEQLTGEASQAQTDIWPLAIILYELLTGGQRPFEAESSLALAQSILLKDPRPLPDSLADNKEALQYVMEKALAKNPLQRYSSAGDFIEDCARIDSGDYRLSDELGLIERGQRRAKKYRGPLLIGTLLLVTLVLGGSAVFLKQRKKSAQESWRAARINEIKALQSQSKDYSGHFAEEMLRRLTQAPSEVDASPSPEGQSFAKAVDDYRLYFEGEKAKQEPELISVVAKELAKLEKMARSWEALVSMSPSTETRAFVEVDKRFQKLLLGYQSALNENWKLAEEEFSEGYSKDNDLASVSRLATLYAQSRGGQSLKALKQLRKFIPDLKGSFRSAADRMELDFIIQGILEESMSPSLISEALGPFEKKWNAKAQGQAQAGWQRLNAKIQQGFQRQLKARRPLKKLALVYMNIHESSRHNPSLKLAPLDARLARYLAKRAARSGSAMAQVFYLELKRLNPQAEIPRVYGGYDEEGNFSYQALTVAFNLKSPRVFCSLLVELSRHNFFLPETSSKYIRRVENEKEQFLSEDLKRYPRDPFLRFWRGYCAESDRINEDYNKRIKALKYKDPKELRDTERKAAEIEALFESRLSDLEQALRAGTLPPVFEGLAKFQYVQVARVRNNLDPIVEYKPFKKRLIELLETVPELFPEPGELSSLRIRSYLYFYSGNDKAKCLKMAEDGFRNLKETYAQSKNSQRPFGLPEVVLEEKKYIAQLSMMHALRAEVYECSQDYLNAHPDYKKSIEIRFNDRILGKWIDMVKRHCNLNELDDIRETVLKKRKELAVVQAKEQLDHCNKFLNADYLPAKKFMIERGRR